MQAHQLKSDRKKKQIRGRGIGSGRGSKSGRGQKGQKSRSGYSKRQGFAGGSNPLFRLSGKKRGAGKLNPKTTKPVTVNLFIIEQKFSEKETVTPRTLLQKKLVNDIKYGVKILAKGDIKKKLIFKNVSASKQALDKIKKVGGDIESPKKEASQESAK